MKNNKTFFAVFHIFPWISFTDLEAYGTSFAVPPVPVTIEKAPLIIRGKVLDKRVEWGLGQDEVKRIYTYYTLELTESLKGLSTPQPAQTLRIREFGGELDQVQFYLPGASQFSLGEDVVVFLRSQNTDGSYDVSNLMLGKLNLKTDADGNEILEGPALHPAELDLVPEFDSSGSPISGLKSSKKEMTQKIWKLSDLRNEIEKQRLEGGPSKTETSQNISKSQPSDQASIALVPSTSNRTQTKDEMKSSHLNSPIPKDQTEDSSSLLKWLSELSSFFLPSATHKEGSVYGIAGLLGIVLIGIIFIFRKNNP